MPQDSRPDIAAWPAPPVEPTSFLLSVSSATKSTPATNARLSSGGHCTPVFEFSVTSPASSTLQQQQSQYGLSAYRYRSHYDIQQHHAKSMSPAASSIAAAASAVVAVAAATSSDAKYGHPRVPSPRPLQPPNHSVASAGSMSNFVEDTSKLLSMLKAVATSNPNATLGRESELRQKIQALEETVAEYERQKFNVMGTFSEYRERVAERERKLEAEYSNRIITFSEEVLGAKKDFETRMKSFQALQEQFKREKEQALEKLCQEHQKEIEVLEQRFSESQLLNLEQKYIIEIQRLEEERKNLKTEKERLGETFEIKLKRAQSLYETELTAAKLLYTRELEALREHEEALKEELTARQEEFHDRLQEIQYHARASKDEMNHCKNEVAILEGKLRQKGTEVQEISRMLSAARNETNAALKRLQDTKDEVNERNDEYNAQKAELEQKSRLLNVAESARTKLEATIRDLQTEVKALRNRVDFLEMERDNLQGQSDSQTQLHNSQVQALEAVLESVTKEKETTKEHYEKLFEQEREQAEEREYSIKQEFSTKLIELEDQYNALREHLEQNANAFEPDNAILWEEIECLRSEKHVLEEEVHCLRSQLTRNQASEFSLASIMALLKAIDTVKAKVNFSSNKPVKNTDSLSSPAISSVKSSLADEDRVLSEEETMRAINAAIDSRLIATNSEPSAARLRLTITDVDGNMHVQDDAVDTVNIEDVLQKIKDIECSLDAIMAEKNKACAKVEQLSEDNRLLIEKLEHFQALHQSILSGKDNTNDNIVAIDELERLQKSLNSYRARIAELEAAAKAAKESYETRLEAQTIAGEERQTAITAELQSEINHYKSRLHSATVELELLREQTAQQVIVGASHEAQIQEKLQEIEALKSEHVCKIQEIEKRGALQLEEKIVSLNLENERKIELVRQQEMELRIKLNEIMKSESRKSISLEVEIQTDSSVASDTNEQREIGFLRQRVDQLVEESKLKEEEMENLRELAKLSKTYEWRDEEIQCEPSVSPLTTLATENAKSWEGNLRKDRSQSMLASPEHLVLCQKAAQRFHNMVEQKKSVAPAKGALRPPSHAVDGIAKSRLYCKERLITKEQIEKSLSLCSSYVSSTSSTSATTTTTTTWTMRNKLPGCYRERSPAAKLRQFDDVAPQQLTVPQHHGGTRSMMLSSEAEIRRRLSPTRQLYFNKNVEKRPAWKF